MTTAEPANRLIAFEMAERTLKTKNTFAAVMCPLSALGFSLTVVMPEGMTYQRSRIIAAYGAELILTPKEEGMAGAIRTAEQIAREQNAYMPSQFTNRSNLISHYEGTGPEIYRNMGGRIDIFVCGIGTGGTMAGVGRYLKERMENVMLVAVEPAESPILSGGAVGIHGIQGIGAGFIPPLLNIELIDRVMTASTERAIAMAAELARREGLSVGISSGAALSCAIELAREMEGKNIVTIFPDGGERYI